MHPTFSSGSSATPTSLTETARQTSPVLFLGRDQAHPLDDRMPQEQHSPPLPSKGKESYQQHAGTRSLQAMSQWLWSPGERTACGWGGVSFLLNHRGWADLKRPDSTHKVGEKPMLNPSQVVETNLLFSEQVLKSATVWEYRKAKTGPLRTRQVRAYESHKERSWGRGQGRHWVRGSENAVWTSRNLQRGRMWS